MADITHQPHRLTTDPEPRAISSLVDQQLQPVLFILTLIREALQTLRAVIEDP